MPATLQAPPEQAEFLLTGVADPSAPEIRPLTLAEIGLAPKKVYIPYDYQLEAVGQFNQWYEDPNEPEALLALATGLGKTFTAALCLRRVLGERKRILWVTHRNELLQQSAQALQDVLGVAVGVEKAEQRSSYRDQVIVASIQTLKGVRLERFTKFFTPHVLVFDEAHHSVARTWMRLKMVYPHAKVLNLTATPFRSDISQRLNLGRVLIERNTTDGIKLGFLVPPRTVGSIRVNLGGVKVSLGDYAPDSLGELMMTPGVMRECINGVMDNLEGRRCVIFAATVEHGRALAEAFRGRGVTGVFEVYGETPIPEREAAYDYVRKHTRTIIINNLCLTEGWDLPAIDFVAIFRPTKNAGLFLQCLGRGLRTSKATGKTECLVLDALDLSKKPTGQSDLILPTDSDQQKAAALSGKSISKVNLFLSWFYHQSDIEAIYEGKPVNEHTRKAIVSAADVFLALTPELDGKWLPSQLRNRERLREILSANVDTEEPFKEVAQLTGTRHIEAFVKVLQDNDWRYFPNRALPKSKEDDEALKAYVDDLTDDGDEFTAETVTLNGIAELVPDLKNFLINVLGEANLAKQAASYYTNFEHNGQLIAWFQPTGLSGFHFIQQWDAATKVNRFWVRVTSTQQVLRIDVNGRRMTYEHADDPLGGLPAFVKGTAWAGQPMTDAQRAHVQRILGIPEADLRSMNISRLSASALMSNNFGQQHLKRIARVLPQALEAHNQKRSCVL